MKKINKLFAGSLNCYLLLFISFAPLAFSNCSSQKFNSKQLYDGYKGRQFLLRDEGLSQLSYVNIASPGANWYVAVPAGRDIQLVGRNRVLIGTGTGYEERRISNGKKLHELTTYPGTIAARRLRNGNTLLTGLDWQGKKGIILVEVDAAGDSKRLISYPGFSYVRLVRETSSGNFLITSDNIVFEGNDKGGIIWQAKIAGADKPHAWQALRLANGKTVVSTGFSKNFQLFAPDGKLTDTIGGPAEIKPNFYAGFQILANGNYVVTNWQGHGPKFGAIGTQLLEYSPDGKLAWSWQQDATKYSSLQGVIVLDDLDLNFLHVEDINGVLAPVKSVKKKR